MTIAFCHGQEHGARHIHIMLVSDRPHLLSDLQEGLVINQRYELEIAGKLVELWTVHPSYKHPLVIRKLLRNLQLLIMDYGSAGAEEWDYANTADMVTIDFDPELVDEVSLWSSTNMKSNLELYIENVD